METLSQHAERRASVSVFHHIPSLSLFIAHRFIERIFIVKSNSFYLKKARAIIDSYKDPPVALMQCILFTSRIFRQKQSYLSISPSSYPSPLPFTVTLWWLRLNIDDVS